MGSSGSRIKYNDIVNVEDDYSKIGKYKHIITYLDGSHKTIVLKKTKEYQFQWRCIMSKPGLIDYRNIKEIINYKKIKDVNYVKKHYETEAQSKNEHFLYEFTIVYQPKKNTVESEVKTVVFNSYQINLFILYVEKYSPVKLNNSDLII